MAGIAASAADHDQDELLLRHLRTTGRGFWLALVILGSGSLWLATVFWLQIRNGHAITGQASQGAIWGVVVANIVNFIGVSHVGIAISAVVRLLQLERYRQLARLAELVTLAAITTAVLNIAMDVGHPERFIVNVVWFGRWHSPFVWSATVITTYVVGSSVYLYLAMRHDLGVCVTKVPRRAWFYRLLSLGYRDSIASRERHTRTVWWLAVIILPIMVSVHSVYGYIFGTQAGRPGWYNPFQAPYFVLGAIGSGFSMVIVLLAILRKCFGWETIYSPRLIKGLGIFLGFITLLYVYFLGSEWLTGIYASPKAERQVFLDILMGDYASITWTMIFGGMLFPFALLFIQGVNTRISSVWLTAFAALLINVALWAARVLIVVPTYYHPLLPWDQAPYRPTFYEWSMVFGSFAVFGLLLLLLIKVVPVLELEEKRLERRPDESSSMPWWKMALIGFSLAGGVGLIATGIALRDSPDLYHPSAIWISGIVLLLSVPMQICVLPDIPIFGGGNYRKVTQ